MNCLRLSAFLIDFSNWICHVFCWFFERIAFNFKQNILRKNETEEIIREVQVTLQANGDGGKVVLARKSGSDGVTGARWVLAGLVSELDWSNKTTTIRHPSPYATVAKFVSFIAFFVLLDI